jgi:Fe2+ or Zn2+ uptake regulation protein
LASSAVIATDSQLGRSQNTSAISRQPLLSVLVARGIRVTSQRRLLVGIIQDSPRHLDAATLLRIAQDHDPEIDRATVYRTISLLKRHGLIDELDLMHLEGEKHFYEVKTTQDHCHLACFQCGAILEYASPIFESLKRKMAKTSGFDIAVIRLEAGGRCRKCRREVRGEPKH